MDKSLAKHGFHRDDVTDDYIYTLTIVVEVYNGTKQAMNLLSRTLNGAMKSLGMGNKTKSERGFFCLKIFCRCKKAGNLILSKGDYLEQSELGFEFFLLMVILISR
jgi:hypothetical protein